MRERQLPRSPVELGAKGLVVQRFDLRSAHVRDELPPLRRLGEVRNEPLADLDDSLEQRPALIALGRGSTRCPR